ncbi:glycosyltransferase family 2 protein [Sphaerotilaceae bacterium SBD11-9]
MNAPARVRVAIVNYRTGALAVGCLRSLEGEVAACPGTQVTVVDNCSGDGSADLIAQAIVENGWSDWARLLRSPVNGGFSYGNNEVVRTTLGHADAPDYYWLLNPDTQVFPGALQALLDFMQTRPKAGIAGSSYVLGNDEPWPYTFHFPSIWSELAGGLRLGVVARLLKGKVGLRLMGTAAERVDWLPGASMLVRREVFESVGLMDEGYFLYFEETDFSLAACHAGWETWYVPSSRVKHFVGQSTGVSGHHAALHRRPQYWFDSRRRYWVKNHGRLYAAAVDLIWSLAYGTWALRNLFQRKPTAYPPHFFTDLLRNSALFRGGLPTSTAASQTHHGHTDRPAQR